MDCLLAGVEYYNSMLFHEQTIQGLVWREWDKMSALPALMSERSVNIPVSTVRPALAVSELYMTVTPLRLKQIYICLERLLSFG